MVAPITSSYQLELSPQPKRIFVTQLREDEDEDEDDIKKIPVIKEKVDTLIEVGFNTLQKTLLLKRQADLSAVDLEFAQKKKEFNERIGRCKQNEIEIKKKQKVLQDRVEKFRKFTEENDFKRERAELKYQQELKLKERKARECEELKVKLENLIKESETLKEKLKRYSLYENYLYKVIDVLPENYIEANDDLIEALMERYETLHTTFLTLSAKRNELQNQHRLSMHAIQSLALIQAQDLLVSNQELVSTKNNLENLISLNKQLEMQSVDRKRMYLSDSETHGQIILSVDNIFDMCDEERNSDAGRISIFQKLDFIGRFVKERQEIYEMSKPKKKETKPCMQTEQLLKKFRSVKIENVNTKSS